MTIGPWMADSDYTSASWPSVTGTVQNSGVTATPRNYRVELKYRFIVGDHAYSGHQYRPSGSLVDTQNEARAIAAQYPAGAQVKVFYDAQDPRDSALRTGLEMKDAYLPLLGVIGLAYGFWPLKKAGGKLPVK